VGWEGGARAHVCRPPSPSISLIMGLHAVAEPGIL